ncbi:MAG: helix-turn-helix domain-containing protein [Rhodanobacteraceae bacterium]
MNARRIPQIDSRLGEIDVDADEERAYRALLRAGAASVADLASALDVAPRRAQRLLQSIERKGFATRSAERPLRYIAIAPDVAIEAKVRQREQNLRSVRAAIADFREETARRRSKGTHEQIVELITSRDAATLAFTQLSSATQHDVVTLQRAPVLVSSLAEPCEPRNSVSGNVFAHGVRVRAIVDSEFLSLPGAVGRVRRDMESGEEVRAVATLPFKTIIFDHRIALVPLNLHDPDAPSLLVRSSALLDALYALFELLWERSTPIVFSPSGVVESGATAEWAPDAEQLVPLLAAGLNDKAIAQELRLSPATLARRVAGLMRAHNTRTRFQLGWMAAMNSLPRWLQVRDVDDAA